MVPLKALDFAIRRCSDFIGAQAHEDIDKDLERVWSHQWDQFICWYYKIVRNEAVFLCTNTPMQVSLLIIFLNYYLYNKNDNYYFLSL